MIAPRLIPRDEWESRLRSEFNCKRFENFKGKSLETGEWWETIHGRIFSVSVDTEGRLRSDDFQQVIVRIAQLKPLDWDTP